MHSKDTLARWLRDVLSKAGLDNQQFGVQSTCVVSTSAAITCGVSVDVLLPAARRSSETSHPFLQEETSYQCGTGPAGFLPSQAVNI